MALIATGGLAIRTGVGLAFTGLTDTPVDYTGAANQAVVVNATEDGLIFVPAGSGAVDSVFGRTGVVIATDGDYSIGQMSDVDITTTPPTVGQFLEWDGTNFVPSSTVGVVDSVFGRTGAVVAQAGDYSAFYATTAQGSLANTATQPGTNVSALANDANYTSTGDNVSVFVNDAGYITSAPVTSVFGRTGVVVAATGDYDINQLGDVTITSPLNGQALTYSSGSSTWVNAAIAGSNVVWVTDFGAVGDGTTDDSAAFQAAIDSLGAEGGMVSVPTEGTWFIDASLNVKRNVSLVRNAGAPIVRNFGTGSTRPSWAGLIYLGTGVQIVVRENASLYGFTLLNNDLTYPITDTNDFAGTAIYIDGPNLGQASHDVKVHNVNILGFAQGLDTVTAKTNRVWLRDIKFDCLGGIRLETTGDRPLVENCHGWPFLTAGNGAILDINYRSGIAFEMVDNVDWVQLVDCLCYHYQIGYSLNGTSTATLQNCQSDADANDPTNVTGTGFYVSGSAKRIRLLGCTAFSKQNPYLISTTATGVDTLPVLIEGCATWHVTSGAVLTVTSGDVTVSDCMFSDWEYAIRRESNAGTVSVNGNSFRNIGTAVMTNDAAVVDPDGWLVGDNTYSDCTRISDASPNEPAFPAVASASTVSIVNFARVTKVTGSVTINNINIATAPMGVPFTLYFVGAPTVTTAAGNIKLAGGAAQAFTAGSTLTLLNDGTNFYEVSRSVI